jgi:hypothetical protein
LHLDQEKLMIRKLALSLLAVLAFSCQANAEFIIDNFFTVDVENDAVATLVHAAGGGNIFVEASTTGGTTVSSAPGAGYSFTGASNTFTLSYTWDVPTFDDLQSISGLELPIVPQSAVGWNLDISTDGVTTDYSGPAISAPGTPPIQLDAATELTFAYTFSGAGLAGQFGGFGSVLIATPEPTALMMLGSVAGLGLIRRRRR